MTCFIKRLIRFFCIAQRCFQPSKIKPYFQMQKIYDRSPRCFCFTD